MLSVFNMTYVMYHNYDPIVTKDYNYFSIWVKDETKKLQITSEHVPVSVSVFSYVPEYDWYWTLPMVSFNGSKSDIYYGVKL